MSFVSGLAERPRSVSVCVAGRKTRTVYVDPVRIGSSLSLMNRDRCVWP